MRRTRSEGEREEKEEESRGRETDCVPRACKLETSASRRGYVLGGLYDPEGAEILAGPPARRNGEFLDILFRKSLHSFISTPFPRPPSAALRSGILIRFAIVVVAPA